MVLSIWNHEGALCYGIRKAQRKEYEDLIPHIDSKLSLDAKVNFDAEDVRNGGWKNYNTTAGKLMTAWCEGSDDEYPDGSAKLDTVYVDGKEYFPENIHELIDEIERGLSL